MEIRITTLSENTATIGFLAEWGLSMLVEADGQKKHQINRVRLHFKQAYVIFRLEYNR